MRKGYQYQLGKKDVDQRRKRALKSMQKVAREKGYATSFSGGGARMKAPYASQNRASMGFTGIEKKFLDTTRLSTLITAPADAAGGEYDPSSGCTGCLSAPAQGDGEQNRDGKKIVLKSLVFKAVVTLNAQNNLAAAQPPTEVFVAIVLDTQTNSAQLNSEDVFKNTTGTAGGASIPVKNLLFGKRFKILKQALIPICHKTVSYDGTNMEGHGVSTTLDWYLPLDIQVLFNAGTRS